MITFASQICQNFYHISFQIGTYETAVLYKLVLYWTIWPDIHFMELQTSPPNKSTHLDGRTSNRVMSAWAELWVVPVLNIKYPIQILFKDVKQCLLPNNVIILTCSVTLTLDKKDHANGGYQPLTQTNKANSWIYYIVLVSCILLFRGVAPQLILSNLNFLFVHPINHLFFNYLII